jgi:hypothetical protein
MTTQEILEKEQMHLTIRDNKWLEEYTNRIVEAHKVAGEKVLRLADQLESDCGKDGDKGTEQWRLFKSFRNTIREMFNIEVK